MIKRHSSQTPSGTARRRSKRAGYTILEVALASFVMVMGLSSSIVTLQRGFREVELARSTTIASQIIQSEMERIRMMSWVQVNDSAILPANSTFDGATNFSTSAKLAGKYSVTRRVTSDLSRPTEVKNISVSVAWSSFDGIPHTRTLTAIYAKNGLYDYYYTIAHE